MTRVYCFEAYGLNKYRNFLGGKFLRGYDLDGVCVLCADILDEYDCGDSAIFIHSFDGEMYIVTWDYEEEMYKLLQSENPKQDFFSIIDGEYRFCCYALIVEARPGLWRVVDD